jgi:type IV pilus assembly protein PilC
MATLDPIIQNIARMTQKSSFGGREKVFFFKELSYLLKGGVSIIESIKTLNESTDNLKLQEITKYMYDAMDNGKSLTYALNRLPQYFNAGDVAIVKSGESSGKLSVVLASLASEYGFLNKIKREYIGAMMYPGILLFVSVAAIFALFVFILPGLFGLVEQFDGTQIPWMTRMLMGFSTFLKNNIIWILVGV